jgi:hypothetical protein
VSVTYDRPDSPDLTVQDTTDANGNYETSADTDNEGGIWSATARYAGTDQYAPSQGETCEFSVD